MIQYFIEVTIAWSILYCLYYLFLRKETFFNANRWYLLNSLWIGLLIPFLRNIPGTFSKAQVILEDPITIINTSTSNVSSFIQAPMEDQTMFSLFTVLLFIYLIGVLITSVRMSLGIYKIIQKINKGICISKPNYTLVVLSEAHLPFSFFKYIFVDQSFTLNSDFNKVLNHEIKHVSAGHTFDVLFLEILSIIFWWNPIIYFYKKSIREAHEFIADSYASRYIDKKNYGHILLGQGSSGIELALTNQFFHSHLKKRINMLFKEKSAGSKRSRYLLALPLIGFLAILFASNTSGVPSPDVAAQGPPPEDLVIKLEALLSEDKFITQLDIITMTDSWASLQEGVLHRDASIHDVHTYLMQDDEYAPYQSYIEKTIYDEGLKYGQEISFSKAARGYCMHTAPVKGHLNITLKNGTNVIEQGKVQEIEIQAFGGLEGTPRMELQHGFSGSFKVESCDGTMTTAELVVYNDSDAEKNIDITFSLQDVKVKRRFRVSGNMNIAEKPSTNINLSNEKENELKLNNEITEKSNLLLTCSFDHRGVIETGKGIVFILKNVSGKPNWKPNIEISNSESVKLEFVDGYSTNEHIHFMVFAKKTALDNSRVVLTCSEGEDLITEELILKKVDEDQPMGKYVTGQSLLPQPMPNALWIINGEISDSKHTHYFTADRATVQNIYEGKEAIEKYGIRARNGAIEISLAKK